MALEVAARPAAATSPLIPAAISYGATTSLQARHREIASLRLRAGSYRVRTCAAGVRLRARPSHDPAGVTGLCATVPLCARTALCALVGSGDCTAPCLRTALCALVGSGDCTALCLRPALCALVGSGDCT